MLTNFSPTSSLEKRQCREKTYRYPQIGQRQSQDKPVLWGMDPVSLNQHDDHVAVSHPDEDDKNQT